MAGISGWLSVSSAAKRLGVSRQRVWVMARRGQLDSRMLYGRMLISTESVERRISKRERRFRGEEEWIRTL